MQTDYGNENVADILGIRNDVPEEPSTPESKSTPESNKIEIKIPWVAILVAIMLSNILAGVIMLIVSNIILSNFNDSYASSIIPENVFIKKRIGVVVEGTRYSDGHIYQPRP